MRSCCSASLFEQGFSETWAFVHCFQLTAECLISFKGEAHALSDVWHYFVPDVEELNLSTGLVGGMQGLLLPSLRNGDRQDMTGNSFYRRAGSIAKMHPLVLFCIICASNLDPTSCCWSTVHRGSKNALQECSISTICGKCPFTMQLPRATEKRYQICIRIFVSISARVKEMCSLKVLVLGCTRDSTIHQYTKCSLVRNDLFGQALGRTGLSGSFLNMCGSSQHF